MSACFGEIEHLATMVTGCENLNLAMSGKAQLNSDGNYAYAVLKLHVADMGSVAGNEGFLDGVKKTAGKVKEWLAALIKAIKEFLTGKKKTVKEQEDETKAIKAKADKVVKEVVAKEPAKRTEWDKNMDKAVSGMDEGIKSLITKAEALKEQVGGEAFKEIGFESKELDHVIKLLKDAVKDADPNNSNVWGLGAAFARAQSALSAEMGQLNDKLNTYTFARQDVTDEQRNKIGSAVSPKMTGYGELMGKLESANNSLNKRMMSGLDSFMKSDAPLEL